MPVSVDLLTKGRCHKSAAVRKFVADTEALEAQELKGKAFHRRARESESREAVLRIVLDGGVPLPAALEIVGLAKPATGPKGLGSNAGDVAAIPTARR